MDADININFQYSEIFSCFCPIPQIYVSESVASVAPGD